jgi:electron transfer flavoprotein alpha subunit
MMGDVLVIAEAHRGDLRDVSYELITAGRELADATGGSLHVAAIGDVAGSADDLNRTGVDTIHTVDAGDGFNHDVYTQVVTQLFDETGARYLLLPHTANGLDYAPAVAEALDLSLATDAIGIEHDDSLVVTREMYGSKVETRVEVTDERAAVTVRPTEWQPAEGAGDATITDFAADVDESAVRSTVTGFEEVASGRGIEEEENLDLIEELVEATGATLAASRPIVNNEWLPKNRQVGQSGKVVTPDVYIAIGISGAVQHVAGMKGSDTIVAINDDPSAPIFDIADYGIVDDLFDVVPALTQRFE